MSNIVQIEFNNLCENCKYMGVQYCKDSHCEVEPFCKLSGIERKLCVSENCPLIYREAKHDSELLDKVAEKLKEKYPIYFNELGMNVNDKLHKDIDEVIAEIKAEVEK